MLYSWKRVALSNLNFGYTGCTNKVIWNKGFKTLSRKAYCTKTIVRRHNIICNSYIYIYVILNMLWPLSHKSFKFVSQCHSEICIILFNWKLCQVKVEHFKDTLTCTYYKYAYQCLRFVKTWSSNHSMSKIGYTPEFTLVGRGIWRKFLHNK